MWTMTGNLEKASKIANFVGRIFGMVMIGVIMGFSENAGGREW